MTKKITQTDIDALLNQSDFEDSALKSSQKNSLLKQQNQSRNHTPFHKVTQTSNQYGDEDFQEFDESKKTETFNNKLNIITKQQFDQNSLYDSYANEDFESYQQSKRAKEFQRRTKEFQRSQQNTNFGKIPQIKQLNIIIQHQKTKEQNEQKISSQKNNQRSETKSNAKPTLIKSQNEIKTQPKSKVQFIKTQEIKENKNIPYNYNRLQEREKQLLFTTLAEENQKLKQVLSQKDKELSALRSKYSILLEEKTQAQGNAKQITLKKQLQQLQVKYDAIVKDKIKEKSYKTVSVPMSKTMKNNFILQEEAEQREQQLMTIIEKLKERLISTDKQLKTLQQKMNEGLDFQEQLQRKLKRVQQLQLRIQKMRTQAEQDRVLIEMLKQKTKQQKSKIEEIQEQKNQLNLFLKRAEMTQATQSDLKSELQEVRREKEMLQKSLKQISLNFTTNLSINSKKQKKPEFEDIIEDSNQLLSYKR